jgi:hypothetical protein
MKVKGKPSNSSGMRELTDRDLNQITRAVGEKVRAQTLEQKERLKREVLQAIESVKEANSRHGR